MIQKFVADRYNVKLTELKAKNNSKGGRRPRQIAMYLTKTSPRRRCPRSARASAASTTRP
jgi:chromosomal replication initiation ATPase DnaA